MKKIHTGHWIANYVEADLLSVIKTRTMDLFAVEYKGKKDFGFEWKLEMPKRQQECWTDVVCLSPAQRRAFHIEKSEKPFSIISFVPYYSGTDEIPHGFEIRVDGVTVLKYCHNLHCQFMFL